MMEIDSPNSEARSAEAAPLDVALYSRQLYVMGHEAMKRMSASNILISGLGPLGVEIAKNVILTGVKSVTVHDGKTVSFLTLAGQFYLSEEDVGKNRATACVSKLSQLNTYVSVAEYAGELTEEYLASFQVVVITEATVDELQRVNEVCHARNIAFIGADVRGVFSYVFCDFGKQFVVLDPDGETPFSSMVAHISKESDGTLVTVTVTEETRLELQDGDEVVFSEVRGAALLNELPPLPIKRTGAFTFTLNVPSLASIDIDHMYEVGSGYVHQVKLPKPLDFKSLRESLASDMPSVLDSDFSKLDAPLVLNGLLSLMIYHQRNGAWPAHTAHAAAEVCKIAAEINANKIELDEKLIKTIALGASGQLAPLAAVVGGVVAQEVLKACSGKFTPLFQWLFLDAREALPEDYLSLPDDLFAPVGNRYDGHVAIYGRLLQEQLLAQNWFLVGAGAIGCEVLKNWAMMGVACGSGSVHVTDMDIIEKSNLSRQFLFRNKDVEQLKSTTAANAAKQMNPSMHIKSYALRVGADSEEVYNDAFYGGLNGVCNALDNIEARMYMDSQCVYYRLPLLESGTLGTKGNTQVVVPFLSESYASSRDPPEKSIPTCTLHHFPNVIEHCLQWARDQFEGVFKNVPDSLNAYLTNSQFADGLRKQQGAAKIEALEQIGLMLRAERPRSFADCIRWARLRLQDLYSNNIQQLLFNFPKDMVTSTGAKFWSGPKRAPTPIEFSMNSSLHVDFVVAAANLRAYVFGIEQCTDLAVFARVLAAVEVPPFVPRRGLAIKTDEKDDKDAADKLSDAANQAADLSSDDNRFDELLAALPLPGSEDLVGLRVSPIDFEKDDDNNFHMDFITACSNLRATNYGIPLADKLKSKLIAGKIIPAMVTTTAVVSGLVCIEMLKVIQRKALESYKNAFCNLALPFFTFSEPVAPKKTLIRDEWSWTLWDSIEVPGPMTLQAFLEHFKSQHKLEISMMSCGVSMIYSFFMPKNKLESRLGTEISAVVAEVSKQALPLKKNHIVFEICCSRLEDDEDVDVPYVRYKFR